MKNQTLSRYNQITVDPRHGGYSDIRLWPCYMVLSGSILFLAPQIGMLLAIVLIGVPSFMIAKKVADMQPMALGYNFEAWDKDCKLAFNKGLEMPDLDAYLVTDQNPATQSVAKRSSKTTSRPTFKHIEPSYRPSPKKPTLQSA